MKKEVISVSECTVLLGTLCTSWHSSDCCGNNWNFVVTALLLALETISILMVDEEGMRPGHWLESVFPSVIWLSDSWVTDEHLACKKTSAINLTRFCSGTDGGRKTNRNRLKLKTATKWRLLLGCCYAYWPFVSISTECISCNQTRQQY